MAEASRLGKCYPDNLERAVAHYNLSRWLSPLYTLRDNFNRIWGETPAPADSNNPFYKGFYQYDLPKEIGSSFDVPLFFFTGADDFHVAYTTTDQWFQKIQAPYKEQVWFKESAHTAHVTEPYLFAKALIEKVLPYAINESGVDSNGCLLNRLHEEKTIESNGCRDFGQNSCEERR